MFEANHMVIAALPHLRLTSKTLQTPQPSWGFVLEDLDGERFLEASDTELGASPQRLALLGLVRGLESLDIPSRLSLFTASRYVQQGLVFGMQDWRDNGWRWDSFGTFVPIKHADLWRRVDHALKYHQLHSMNLLADPTAMASSRTPDVSLRIHRLDIRRVWPAWDAVSHRSRN
jgi:ribonuclease HI